MTLDAFLQAMIEDPCSAPTTWAVLADWLEDQDDPRAELVRLLHQPDYHHGLPAHERDERVRQLLASGVGPVAPALVNSIGMKLMLIPSGTFQLDEAPSCPPPPSCAILTISRRRCMWSISPPQPPEQYFSALTWVMRAAAMYTSVGSLMRYAL